MRGRLCNRLLFYGMPENNVIEKPKVFEIVCPKCGAINIVKYETVEKIVVRLKED